MREDERELLPFCAYENIGMAPYSSLASGCLSRRPGECSKRLELYNSKSSGQDQGIIDHVNELSQKKNVNVSMSEIALAWLRYKTPFPKIGATKKYHIDTFTDFTAA